MGLREIKQAGEMAAKISQAADNMNAIHNQYANDYANVLQSIQGAFGSTVTMSTMTSEQINILFFAGLGDDVTVNEAITILKEWETLILALTSSVSRLPMNNN